MSTPSKKLISYFPTINNPSYIKFMNPKNKGNSFERKVANLLSDKFATIYNKSQAFRRNPDSGSFFGGVNESRIQTHHESSANFGDIITPPDFNFSIECKHYKESPGAVALISQNIPQWDKWIQQAEADARKSNKDFLLIIKYNRVSEIVITSDKKFPGIRYKNYQVLNLSDLMSFPEAMFIKDPIVN